MTWKLTSIIWAGLAGVLFGTTAAGAQCPDPESFTNEMAQELYDNPTYSYDPFCDFMDNRALERSVNTDGDPDTSKPVETVSFNVGWDAESKEWRYLDLSDERLKTVLLAATSPTCAERMSAPSNQFPRRKRQSCEGLYAQQYPVEGCQNNYKDPPVNWKIRGIVWVDYFLQGQYGNPNSIWRQRRYHCDDAADYAVLEGMFSTRQVRHLCKRPQVEFPPPIPNIPCP